MFFTTTDGRGTTKTTTAGASGLYVGTLNGCVWVAWDAADFPRMCAAFDAALAKMK